MGGDINTREANLFVFLPWFEVRKYFALMLDAEIQIKASFLSDMSKHLQSKGAPCASAFMGGGRKLGIRYNENIYLATG